MGGILSRSRNLKALPDPQNPKTKKTKKKMKKKKKKRRKETNHDFHRDSECFENRGYHSESSESSVRFMTNFIIKPGKEKKTPLKQRPQPRKMKDEGGKITNPTKEIS